MSKKRSFRFTLIELLVVIAIIAILAAILLPALNQARERGKSTTCLNNNKTMIMVIHQYTDEGDGYLPYFRTKDFGFTHGLGGRPSDPSSFTKIYNKMPAWWASARCPELPYVAVSGKYAKKLFNVTYGLLVEASGNYMYYKNGNARRDNSSGDVGHGNREVYYKLPFSKRPIIGDSFDGKVWESHQVKNQIDHIFTQGSTSNYRMHMRHQDTAILAFHDGHAEGKTAEALHAEKIAQASYDKNYNLVSLGAYGD